MRFVFFGTPRFAKIILDELKGAGLHPTLLVTLPDRKKGRGLLLTPSEVKVWGEREHIPVFSPEKLDDAAKERIAEEHPDCLIVAAYGKILPSGFLALAPKGALNVHPSLLPKFRGPSPIESAILSEETGTGVSIIILDREVDHGAILAQRPVPVPSWPPKGSVLTELLAHEGGKLLAEILPDWQSGTATAKEQDHTRATFTKKIQKIDGLIDRDADPALVYKKIQAFDEWPGAYFFLKKKDGSNMRVIVKHAEYSGGKLRILRVVPEGKKEMTYDDLLRGH